jgi:succinate dehydrogenase / fumarate reductase cytochrome b subunit
MNQSSGRAAPSRARPKFRNIEIGQILQYRLPPAGIASILHRVSGALMFLVGLPVVLYLFQSSLGSQSAFEGFKGFVSHPLAKLLLLGLIWAYLHHFCAGIRYLLLDLHIGADKDSARKSALSAIAISLVLTALAAIKLFGGF